tara:strand:+ start:8839 stop:10251 length:1413 start_codon:yes stop_codon:yes gene_type:complete
MNSIRSRLLILLISGVFGSMLVGGIALYLVAERNLMGQYRGALLAQAQTLATFVSLDEGIIRFEIDGSRGLPKVYTVIADDGTVVSSAGNYQWEEDETQRPPVGTTSWAEVELLDDSDGDAVMITVELGSTSRLSADSTDQGNRFATILVAGERGPVEEAIAAVNTAIIGTGLLVLFTTGLLVLWGVHRGLKPLDNLASRLVEIEADNLVAIRPDHDVPSELLSVYHALGDMLTQIRKTIDRERRFSDATAHELRTPIAELRTLIDVAQKWPEPDRLKSSIEKADTVVNRMSSLLSALLLLGRESNCRIIEQDDNADVHATLSAEIKRFETLAEANGTPIDYDHESGIEWTLPVGAILIITQNLLSNAIEYTPSGGLIQVDLQQSTNGKKLRITNGPVDLSESQIQHLFEPFWRAEQSRSNQDHFGLGLGIVAQVCTNFGLEYNASLSEGLLTLSIQERVAKPIRADADS